MSNSETLALPAKHAAKRSDIRDTEFIRKYGILLVVVLAFIFWTLLIWFTSAGITKARVTNILTGKYEVEYTQRIEAYIQEQEIANTPTEDEVLAKQMRKEADILAKVIGTMNTKQMKLSMLWNILMRVDSPYYPNTVAEVVNQPNQWMFYKESNPIRDDDANLAYEQLKLWHEGRYPAGLSSTFVYGEWSEHDYVLRDTWDKDWKTKYWRFPE